MANLVTDADKPMKVSSDAGMAEQFAPSEKKIAADHEAEKAAKLASGSVWAGARMNRAVPPSTLGKAVQE